MRKVVVRENGGPEVLEVVTSESPTLKPGEVLADFAAAGVNCKDVYQRQGTLYIPKPFTPGFEGLETLRQVGEGVSTLKAGNHVAWINAFGSYAGQIVLPVAQAILVPDSFSTEDGLLFQAVTAQYLVVEYRSIQPGDVVFVQSAAGWSWTDSNAVA